MLEAPDNDNDEFGTQIIPEVITSEAQLTRYFGKPYTPEQLRRIRLMSYQQQVVHIVHLTLLRRLLFVLRLAMLVV